MSYNADFEEEKFSFVSEALRHASEFSQLSQTEIAEKLGVSPQYLSKVKNKRGPASESLIQGLEELTGLRLNDRLAQKSINKNAIRFYDLEATAGQVDIFNDVNEKYVTSNLILPSFNDCDFAINISGDSMYPKYCHADVVLCKKIEDTSVINYGEAFLIVTKEQRMVKFIHPGTSKETITLVSENPKFPSWELERDKILHLYAIKGVLRRKMM